MTRLHIFIFLAVIILFPSCKGSKILSAKILESGVASWYGPGFHGKKTANGETYNMRDFTAAHRTLPFDTRVQVKNLDNGRQVEVRINDRGPFAKNRIIDLSQRAAEALDMIGPGTANVQLILIDQPDRSLPRDLKSPSYTIQIASFQTKKLAQEKKASVKGSRVESIMLNGEEVYRVYYGTFSTNQVAEQELLGLKRKGIDGFVKQIEN